VIDFFIWCSGADKNILEHCPTPEIAKCEGIGGTVFFTGLFAMLSGGYALSFVFHSDEYALLFAIVFGIIWGLFIFNLDRYIVSSMNKQGGFWADFKLAIPRLILATLIAYAIATPLELKLFETEIDKQLFKEQKNSIREEYELNRNKIVTQVEKIKQDINGITKDIKEKNKQKKELESNLSNAEKILDQRKKELGYENLGKGLSGKPGCGYHCKLLQSRIEDTEKNIKRLTQEKKVQEKNIDSLQTQKADKQKLKAPLDSKIANLYILEQEKINKLKQKREKMEKNDDLIARREAFGNLTSKNDTLFFIHIFIMLLFLAIETAPIFVKLISIKGPYDKMLEKKSRKAITGYTDIKPIPIQVPTVQEVIKKPVIEKKPDIWRKRHEDVVKKNKEKR